MSDSNFEVHNCQEGIQSLQAGKRLCSSTSAVYNNGEQPVSICCSAASAVDLHGLHTIIDKHLEGMNTLGGLMFQEVHFT